MTFLRTFVSAAALLAAFSVHAQEAGSASEDPQDEDSMPMLRESIVVTANRAETPARAVGSSVTVITAEEIALRNKTSVAELLRTVPGLEVVRGGGPGQVTSVFIRGGSSSQTLVLIDGVRVNAPATGAFDFAYLATDNIERIEIVRGPQSTLYGSEAVAGVVSIFTRRGRPGFHVSGLAEAGDADHQRLRLSVDGGGERFDYAISVSDESTDGVSVAGERAGNREPDPFANTSASAHFGFGVGGDGRVDLHLRYFDGEAANDGFDFLLGPVDDFNRQQRREGLTASLGLRQDFGPRWHQAFTVSLNDDELSGTDPDDFFSNFTVDSRSLELTSQSDVNLSPNDVLTFGLSYEDREVTSLGENVDITSVFVQNAWSWEDRLHLTAGLRHDDHSQYGGESTFRLSSSWSLGVAPEGSTSKSTRLHATYGTGFKAPTLNDLFFPFFGNPDLRPETSEGFDLGIEHSWGARAKGGHRWTLDVTYFDTDFEDLIAFSFATFLPENVAVASSSGVEVSVAYRPGPKFQLAASHTYNDTENLTTGAQLARRPENRSTLSFFFRPLERWSGSAALFVGSDRIDSDGSEMDDYERLDLSLAYDAGHLEPYLRVENLLDADYEEIGGFTTPGTVVVVGLGFKY